MPYVPQGRRGCYVELKEVPQTEGELNYLITSICLAYMREHSQYEGVVGPTYVISNQIIGALECAKLEFYRRQVAPLEDRKAAKNGDIPWLQS